MKADTITKDYVKDADVFADIFNYYIYGSRLFCRSSLRSVILLRLRCHTAQMLDEEIMKFQSSLREVMFFIKHSKDRENLSKVLKANEKRFREVERRAVDVIEVIINSGIKYDESEAKVDMCQAIQEIRKEERKIGELNKAKEDAVNFYKLGVEVEKIAQGVGYAVETVKEWIGLES